MRRCTHRSHEKCFPDVFGATFKVHKGQNTGGIKSIYIMSTSTNNSVCENSLSLLLFIEQEKENKKNRATNSPMSI